MAIEGNLLVVTSAKREGLSSGLVPTPICSIISNAPPPFIRRNAAGVFEQPAEYEGQTRVVETSTRYQYNLYVVVDIGGVLTWKAVKPSSGVIDPRTGNPYDANADFYNPLAT